METLENRDAELAAERVKSDTLTARLATAEANRSNLERRLGEEAARLAEIQTQFRAEFENLANRILEEKSAKFLTQNHEHLSVLLDPLRQRLGEFRDRIETIHTEDIQSTAALREQLLQLKDLNRRMTDEAGALTRALKGESKTQGSWGELSLERILEKSGLHLALKQDGALFGDAFERNVVLVSSSTLLITLRAIESVWRRQKQTLNALEIARQAGNLHDQFVLFVESLQEIGQRLDQARAAYPKFLKV